MKAIKISDQTHSELTRIVGKLTAESSVVKTYEDAVEALLHKSVIMPPEILQEIEDFIEKNKQFGYSSKEEFLRGAVRWLIDHLSRTHITTLLEADLKGDCSSVRPSAHQFQAVEVNKHG
jgi:hemerythrin